MTIKEDVVDETTIRVSQLKNIVHNMKILDLIDEVRKNSKG